MNVTVENLAPCKKLLRVEVDVQTVDTAFDDVVKDFQRHANLPGFRAGKAPRTMVENAYGSRIQDEVKKKLIGDAYRQAVSDNKLRVVVNPDIEEIQFGRGQVLQFAATVELEPEFELPEYKGLDVKREAAVTTDADVERALGVLAEQRAEYKDVERPVQDGDFVVVNYTGTCDGKPITDTAPTARGLTEQKNYWLKVEKDSFIPGFTEQLVGAKSGDKRTVNVDFPADFVSQPLAGKKGVYEVELVGVKERILPVIDEEFAKSFGAEGLEKLREGVKADLQNELSMKQSRSVRDQLVRALLDKVTCDLPETVVNTEVRNVVYNIVNENQQRGVPKETIEAQKDQIFSVASTSAKDRVKSMFILHRIANKEGIKVEQQELIQRIHMMAQQYQTPVDKLVKELQQRNGIAEVQEQILSGKVLDFLQLNAKIEEVPASTGEAK
ncbi:MAG TPA: trigger factor [Roseimicrobium sp.]|nr:trigger factor [Roseimicrobium sp.]